MLDLHQIWTALDLWWWELEICTKSTLQPQWHPKPKPVLSKPTTKSNQTQKSIKSIVFAFFGGRKRQPFDGSVII